MKEISLKAIENAGFKVVEGIEDCFVTAPIDMASVDGGMLSDLDIGTFDLDLDNQEIEAGDLPSTYAIFKDNDFQDELYSLDEVKEFFEEYFEEHPKEL